MRHQCPRFDGAHDGIQHAAIGLCGRQGVIKIFMGFIQCQGIALCLNKRLEGRIHGVRGIYRLCIEAWCRGRKSSGGKARRGNRYNNE